MEWKNVSRKVGSHTRLVTIDAEIHKITECTMTFYLTGTEWPDERHHPFFTGVGPTPDMAEGLAYLVYLRAQTCSHQFERLEAMTQVCTGCGVMRRARPPALHSVRSVWRRWFRKTHPSASALSGVFPPQRGPASRSTRTWGLLAVSPQGS